MLWWQARARFKFEDFTRPTLHRRDRAPTRLRQQTRPIGRPRPPQSAFFLPNASINGETRSSGNGNTMVEALPLLDMSAMVCK